MTNDRILFFMCRHKMMRTHRIFHGHTSYSIHRNTSLVRCHLPVVLTKDATYRSATVLANITSCHQVTTIFRYINNVIPSYQHRLQQLAITRNKQSRVTRPTTLMYVIKKLYLLISSACSHQITWHASYGVVRLSRMEI